jgi:hypothetical protein
VPHAIHIPRRVALVVEEEDHIFDTSMRSMPDTYIYIEIQQ